MSNEWKTIGWVDPDARFDEDAPELVVDGPLWPEPLPQKAEVVVTFKKLLPGHYVQWTIDTDAGPRAVIYCHRHPYDACWQNGECTIAEFLNNDGVENSYQGPQTELRSGPISPLWHKEGYYTWQYTEGGKQ